MMISFARLCAAIAATSKKLEKIQLAADFFRSAGLEEAAAGALFLTGRAFPRSEERVLNVGAALLVRAVLKVSGWSGDRFSEIYRRHGDLGDTADDILQARTAPSEMTLREVRAWFLDLSEQRAQDPKLARIEELLRRVSAIEAKYLLKIATGDLRIGLKENLVEEAIALAYDQPPALVQRANMFRGDIAEILRLAASGQLQSVELQLFRPVSVMLANPAEDAAELEASFPTGAIAEDKYDGIRAQVHKQGDRVEFYSRSLDRITGFPELLRPLAALPGDFVMDGEILAWRDGRALPFSVLQPRLGRTQLDLFTASEAPVIFMAFDLLHHAGRTLLESPWTMRRAGLEAVVSGAAGDFLRISRTAFCQSAGEYDSAFHEALARGNEGLLVKAPDSLYMPGRRGNFWLKLKKPLATLDVVVTAVEYGHGKRHGVLSDYTFAVRDGEKLLEIGKAYSGLTDAEIRDLTSVFLNNSSGQSGHKLQVRPLVVLEVAFNNMQRSKRHSSGFALRFPRIVRVRTDKSPQDIDTLAAAGEIFARQTRAASETR